MQPELDRVEALADEVRADGITTVYLLGMGGSSLCAEVMRSGLRRPRRIPRTRRHGHDRRGRHHGRAGHARTRADAVPRREQERRNRRAGVDGEGVLGSTCRRRSARRPDATSSPSPIRARSSAHLAESRGYRKIFLNPPDIGGRFSALSLFGLVPGALIGAPVRDMLSGGADMAEGCRQENHKNAGLELGVFIGAAPRKDATS